MDRISRIELHRIASYSIRHFRDLSWCQVSWSIVHQPKRWRIKNSNGLFCARYALKCCVHEAFQPTTSFIELSNPRPPLAVETCVVHSFPGMFFFAP